MAQELIDKYTRSLYNIINIDEIDIFHDITFDLPQIADIDTLKTLFENTYMYHEIGVETISKFLDRLSAKIYDLCLKYKPLFNVFGTEFTSDDVYSNNSGDVDGTQKFFDTPQSQIDAQANYLTSETDTHSEEKRLVNLTKAEARELYANKLRFLYHEFVKDCRGLFMEVF